jgi:hypothetical protein
VEASLARAVQLKAISEGLPAAQAADLATRATPDLSCRFQNCRGFRRRPIQNLFQVKHHHKLAHQRGLSRSSNFLADYRASARPRLTPAAQRKAIRQKFLLAAVVLEMQQRVRRMPRSPLNSRIRTIRSQVGGQKDEEYIPGDGPGIQGGTFVDITAVNKLTGKTLRIQTVDTPADGVTPTPREQEAAARIRKARPNDELILIPKRRAPWADINLWADINSCFTRRRGTSRRC